MYKAEWLRKLAFLGILYLFWLSLVFPYMMLAYRVAGGSQMAYMVEHNRSEQTPVEPVGFFTPSALRNWRSAVFSEYFYGKVTLFCGPEAMREFIQTRSEIAQTPQASRYLECTGDSWGLLWYLGEGEKAVAAESLPRVEEMAARFDPIAGQRSGLLDLRYFGALWSRIAIHAPREALAYREYGFLLAVLPAAVVGLVGMPFILPAALALAFLPRLLCPLSLIVYVAAVTYWFGRKIITAG